MKVERFQTKKIIRQAVNKAHEADTLLEGIRQHFDMEWGDNGHCDLDLALRHAIEKLAEARRELNKVLENHRGKAVRLNWGHGRSWV